MSRLLYELSPFSYLKRSKEYLEKAICESAFPEILRDLSQYVGYKGYLPRVVPVALVQEPVLADGLPVGFGGFTVLSGGRNPRAIIITLSCVNITLVQHCSDKDFALALLKTNQTTIAIGSLYHDISNTEINIKTDLWVNLSNKVLIGGDANAYSSLWGSNSNNNRGDKWEEFILANDLEVANSGNSVTFENHLGSSTIDITLVKNLQLSNWSNTGLQYGSDHYLITFQLSCSATINQHMVQNIATTDWQCFQSNLKQLVDNPINSTAELEARARTLITNIKEAFNAACPPKRALPCKPCKWWNNDLGVLLRKKEPSS